MNEKVTKDDMRELTETETEKVAGGHVPSITMASPMNHTKQKMSLRGMAVLPAGGNTVHQATTKWR